jgi:hypothetical protein
LSQGEPKTEVGYKAGEWMSGWRAIFGGGTLAGENTDARWAERITLSIEAILADFPSIALTPEKLARIREAIERKLADYRRALARKRS